ncbi:MAG: FG-GAP-like repeat-containing protein [Chloroflexia bacterium]
MKAKILAPIGLLVLAAAFLFPVQSDAVAWPARSSVVPPADSASTRVDDHHNVTRLAIASKSDSRGNLTPPDPDLEPGFPVQTYDTAGQYHAGPAIHTLVGNIDADPQLEIIVTALAGGPLYAWNYDGSPQPGWPPGGADGAGYPVLGNFSSAFPGFEIFSGHFWTFPSVELARNGSGTILPGWPHTINYAGTPGSAVDIDGDGLDEIFTEEEDGALHGYRADGTSLPGWPVGDGTSGQERHTPAIGDIDGDGQVEIVTVSGSTTPGVFLYAYHTSDSLVSGFPVLFPNDGWPDTFPVIGDVDGNGTQDIVVLALDTVKVISGNGTILRSWPTNAAIFYGTAPALADLDGDHIPEIIIQTGTTLTAYDGYGAPLPGWPVSLGSSSWSGNSSPVVGDIDGDGFPDVAVTQQDSGSCCLGSLQAFDRFGEMLPHFPKPLRSGAGSVPAIADIDLDGRNELVVTADAWDGISGYYDKVWAYDLHGPGPYGRIEWGQFGGGPKHENRYVPAPPPGTPTPTVTGTPPTGTRTLTRTPTRTPNPCPNYYFAASAGANIVPGTVDIGSHCDECIVFVTPPFPYTFYGRRFNSVGVGSNGVLQFYSQSSTGLHWCLPFEAFDHVIMPLWTDLDTRTTNCPSCGVFTSVSGTAPNRVFNIEWKAVYHASSILHNFEVRLYEGQARFDFIYAGDAWLICGGCGATVGVQRDGDFYTQYACNNSGRIYDGLRLAFTQSCTVPATPTATVTSTPMPTACNPQTVHAEGFEAGTLGSFTSVVATCTPGGCGWNTTTQRGHTGAYSAFAPDVSGTSDQRLELTGPISIPAQSNNYARLTFWQAYGFETWNGLNYDGGVLEVSTDNGASWSDAGANILSGGYRGSIADCCGNPLGGRRAWVLSNPGGLFFDQVVVNLLPYAGQSVKFRFREGTGDTGASLGWWIDDVQVAIGGPCGSSTATRTGSPLTHTPTVTPSRTVTGTPPTSTRTYTPTHTVTGTPPTLTRTATACSISFQDVPPDSPFYSFARCLACRQIVSGYTCGGLGEPCVPPSNYPYFRTFNSVTRGQIAKVVSNARGFNDVPGPQLFADVPPGSPFYPYVQRVGSRHIISGYTCGGPGEPCVCPGTCLPYFRPNASTTRGQLSKIVSNAAGYSEPHTEQTFEDVPNSHTFYVFIERLASQGIISGYACGSPGEPCVRPLNRPYFRPGNNVTRGQSAKIAANAFVSDCSEP